VGGLSPGKRLPLAKKKISMSPYLSSSSSSSTSSGEEDSLNHKSKNEFI